jgi:glycosyltransferase involved in cell wall biosynthesis
MKISIVHPSRNRVKMATEAVKQWKKAGVEYILSVDYSDTAENYIGYQEIAKKNKLKLAINHNKNCVDAVNAGAKQSSGDWIVVVSDDFNCPENWVEKLREVVGFDSDEPRVILINDGISQNILSLPIMNRKAYEMLGYIYYPKYSSMFADTDLFAMAKSWGWLIDARHLLFEHNHFTNGKNETDEAYLRQNQGAFWAIGKALFERRIDSNFDWVDLTEPERVTFENQIEDSLSQNPSQHPNLKPVTKISGGGQCN